MSSFKKIFFIFLSIGVFLLTISSGSQKTEENLVLKNQIDQLKNELDSYEKIDKMIKDMHPSEFEKSLDLLNKDKDGDIEKLLSYLDNNNLSSDDMLEAYENVTEISGENKKLKELTSYYKKKIGKGLGYPPCWSDGKGNIEYLFRVDPYPEYVKITRAWPERRAEDAEALPNIDELVNKEISYDDYMRLADPIFKASKNSEPECRHYVKIYNKHIDDRKTADDRRLIIEEKFYKLEIR